jgi:hypothetical protein
MEASFLSDFLSVNEKLIPSNLTRTKSSLYNRESAHPQIQQSDAKVSLDTAAAIP